METVDCILNKLFGALVLFTHEQSTVWSLGKRNTLTVIKCEKGSRVGKGKEPNPPSQPWSRARHVNQRAHWKVKQNPE